MVTNAWRAAVTESHEIKTVVDVYKYDMPTPFATLGVTEGQLTKDSGGETRQSGELTVIDDEGALSPGTAEVMLSPFDVELRIWSGIIYRDGTEEMESQGYFPVTEYKMVRDGRKRMYRLTVFDRSHRCQQDFGRPYSTIPGRSLEDAIRDLIWFQAPAMRTVFPATGFTVPALIFAGDSNPWKEAVALAGHAGYTLEVNGEGEVTMARTVLDVGLSAEWEFVDNARSPAWEVESEMKSDDAPNHVIVRGDGTNKDSLFGEAMDMDPLSPTYVGKIGHRIKNYSDVRITSNDMATRAAGRILARDISKSKTHPMKVLPNPALKLDSTVKVSYEPYGINTFALVDKIDLPLVAGDDKHMPVTVRRGVRTDTDLITIAVSP